MKPPSKSQERYIASLRVELGIATTRMPVTAREAHNTISELLRRRETKERHELDREAAAAGPKASVVESIQAAAARLGLAVDVPATAAEAEFVLDDLRYRERLSRRVADGSLG